MVTNGNHEFFLDLGCSASYLGYLIGWQDTFAECFNQSGRKFVLLHKVVCQERFSLVRVFMEIAQRHGIFVHAAHEFGRSNTVTVIADKRNLHEVFEDDSPKEVNKLICNSIHCFYSCECQIHGFLEISHNLVPNRMPPFELTALIREAIKGEVICHKASPSILDLFCHDNSDMGMVGSAGITSPIIDIPR